MEFRRVLFRSHHPGSVRRVVAGKARVIAKLTELRVAAAADRLRRINDAEEIRNGQSNGVLCNIQVDVESLSVAQRNGGLKIGRASCRERVCQYVSILVVAVSLKKKKENK